MATRRRRGGAGAGPDRNVVMDTLWDERRDDAVATADLWSRLDTLDQDGIDELRDRLGDLGEHLGLPLRWGILEEGTERWVAYRVSDEHTEAETGPLYADLAAPIAPAVHMRVPRGRALSWMLADLMNTVVVAGTGQWRRRGPRAEHA